MAEEIKIKVDYTGNLEKSKGHVKQLESEGGFKGDGKNLGSVKNIIQELEALTKISTPTAKQITRIEALFNELSDILVKVSNRVKTTSETFHNLEKTLEQQTKGRKALADERSKILKQGRINKESKKYALFKTTQNEIIAEAGLTSGKTKQPIKKTEAFYNKFDAEGNPIEGAFGDPKAAKATYDRLKTLQEENATKLADLNSSIDEYDRQIDKTNQQLQIEAGKTGSISGDIIANKIDVAEKSDNAKALLRDKKNATSPTLDVGGTKSVELPKSKGMAGAFKQLSLYAIAIKAAKAAWQEAVKTVKELDKYLTEQAMVTGLTRQETYKLVGSYQELALACGATTKEIAQVATEYMKQGKTIADTMTLTEAAVKAAKVARVSVGDSVNYLTTALNGFRLSADQAMAVSDKFAAVAAASATDYDELAIALSKVASQANLAGMSIDYTTALLTKGLETTREAPETMGTALKTIIARMRELSDYGETLGGDTDINKVESQLAYVGIALRDTSGELRSTEDVLDELGHKWDDLNKNQQAAIAKALAGTRQQSRLIAMMDDYERVTELQQIAQRSAGATAAQAATYLQGMEAAVNKIQVAWETLIMKFTDSDFVIGVFNLIGDSIKNITKLLSNLPTAIPIFTTLGVLAFNALGHKLRELKLAKDLHKIEQERKILAEEQEIAKAKEDIDKYKTAKTKEILENPENDEKIAEEKQQILDAASEEDKTKLKEAQDAIGTAKDEVAKVEDDVKSSEDKETSIENEINAIDEEVNKKEEVAKKWEEKVIQDEINVADAEGAVHQAQAIVLLQEQVLLRQQSLELVLQEKIANGEATANDEQRLATLQQKIGLTQQDIEASKRDLAQKQTALDSAKKTLATDQKTAKTMRTKADNAKKEANTTKRKLKDQLNKQKDITKKSKEDLKIKKDALTTAEDNLKKTEQEVILKSVSNSEAVKNAEIDVSLRERALGLLKEQAGQVGVLQQLWGNVQGIMSFIPVIQKIIKVAQDAYNAGLKKEKFLLQQNNAERKKSLGTIALQAFGSIVAALASIGPWGIPIGIAIGTAIAAVIGVGIAASMGAFSSDTKRDNAANDIKNLSAEIYKLEESAQSLESTADHFEALDNKVLKTKEDIQAMNEDLEKIGETMSETDPDDGKNDTEYDKDIAKITGGKSEAEYYAGLTDERKVEFARQKAELQRQQADRLRDKQVEVLQNLTGGWEDRDGNGIDEYYTAEQNQRYLLETNQEVRDAFYAYNKNQLYDYIDSLKEGSEEMAAISEEEAAMLEGVTQNLLDNMDAWDAYQYAQNPEKVRELADTLRSVQVNGKQALEVLQGISDDEETEISLKEKVAAYNALKDSLDETTRAAFMMEYQEFEFWSTLSDKALDLLDNINLSNDAINDIYGAYDKLNKILEEDLGKTAAQLDADTYKTMIDSVWDSLDEDFSNFEDVLKSTFGSIIGDSEDAWNALVSSIGDEIATTILDMGQEMEAFGNTINSFYEKASEWNELKESEKMEFIADNSELFSGEGGAALLEAFESGNYNAIEEALGAQMAEKQEQQLQQIRRTLAIEEARVGEDRNEAYIAALKQYEQHLMDTNNLYKASLDLRLEQEEAQIEKYKEYLEAQQEALTESLEKRKEAYEKYFESINQEQDDEDYEEEATRLIDNIAQLSSSTNANAMQQTAELQQELENLEEERLQELRERAQDAVIENIDTTIEEINDKFDKLLDSNQALLLAMQGELDNPLEFMTDMIVSQAGKNQTALKLEQYLQDLQGTYGNIIGNDVFENMSVREENGQLILNIRGEEITLTQGDEQSIFTAVMDALRAVGLK